MADLENAETPNQRVQRLKLEEQKRGYDRWVQAAADEALDERVRKNIQDFGA